jgi:hypothetical protein
MQHSTTRVLSVFAIVGAAVLGLSACASSGSGDTTPAPTSTSGSGSSTSALPPIIVELDAIDGTTVEVPFDNVIDLVTADGDDVTAWTAKLSDESVAEFVPGKDDGSAQFNPGITPLAEGTTDVVMSNPTTDATVSFTVTVTAASK